MRRWFGPGAGLIAGAVLALTPAAALIFRFNNPDALLVLLMTAAGYACSGRSSGTGPGGWCSPGVLLGFAFLTKMVQAFLVLPGFGLAYLWAGPARLRRRIWQLLAALGGLIAGAGWWVAIAELIPAADRPYFGGSTDNNILELALGYNGLGRLSGSETGLDRRRRQRRRQRLRRRDRAVPAVRLGVRRPGQLADPGGAALARRAALGIKAGRRAPRGSARSPSLWGGWLLVTGLVFSYMQGIIHPYYMVALAPAIGALVGVGAMSLWQAGLSIAGRICAAVGVLGIGSLGLRPARPDPDVAAVAALDRAARRPARRGRRASPSRAGPPDGVRRVTANAAGGCRLLGYAPLALALVAGLGGPLAYSLDTANTTHTGSIPSAGPTVAGSFGGPAARAAVRAVRRRLRRRTGTGRHRDRHRDRDWHRHRHSADRHRRRAERHDGGSPARRQRHRRIPRRCPGRRAPARSRRNRLGTGTGAERHGRGNLPRAACAAAQAARWAACPAAPRSAAR